MALATGEWRDSPARSIKYQMASASLPMAKELADFDFAASSVHKNHTRCVSRQRRSHMGSFCLA